MKYVLTFSCPSEQIIQVAIHAKSKGEKTLWKLPRWRPGRYELQQFERNIRDFTATDIQGSPLQVEKLDTHTWMVLTPADQKYTIRYEYFACQLDAGGSYIDHDLIYVNGISLFMYEEGFWESPCTLQVELPEGFNMGGAISAMPMAFDSFHHLVDTPFMASPMFELHQFEVEDISVTLSVHGAAISFISDMAKAFKSFIQTQYALFTSSPIQNYTFWFLLLPYRYRHGVEHQDSTVIVIGPWYSLGNTHAYDSLLEISCHEFFHVWNVKAFRPKELTPYDYSKPIHSSLHYITEGITTYYGYAILWRSGIWNFEKWITSINSELANHYKMGGKDYVSLEEASFDSWIRGYNRKGVPNRRISFYTKGHLVALILDAYIRQRHAHQTSLDDVMRHLYLFCQQAKIGYTQEDFIHILTEITDISVDAFFEKYISGTVELIPALEIVAEMLGLELKQVDYTAISRSLLGIETDTTQGATCIKDFVPNSTATAAGLLRRDILVALDGHQITDNWQELLLIYRGESNIPLHFFRLGKLHKISLDIPEYALFTVPQFVISDRPTPEQLTARALWRQVSQLDKASQ